MLGLCKVLWPVRLGTGRLCGHDSGVGSVVGSAEEGILFGRVGQVLGCSMANLAWGQTWRGLMGGVGQPYSYQESNKIPGPLRSYVK